MSSLVDLEVFRSRKDFATAGKGAGEGLLPRVDADVIDQLVFGFERFSLSGAILPVAGMVGNLRPTNVFHCNMGDYLMHGSKELAARLPGMG